ncbi:methyl-accepting chemotaxis protein [Metabacillus niabensis]|uniref:methyl-accepting chemotaxis protein n=1 Tax=Metabacillus niabensis TaxID=324854 RepID=UPI001CF99791|nr:methyl-accepting chemotaxis protein [Metabacillus niabensis]
MNLSIKRKIIGSFLIVSIIFGAASLFSYHNMKQSNESYEYVIETVAELRAISQAIQTDTALQSGYYRAYMLYDDESFRDKMNEANTQLNESISRGLELSTLQETKDRLQSIQELNDQFKETANRVMDEKSIDETKANKDGLNLIVPISTSLTEEALSMNTWLRDDILEERVKETKDESDRAQLTLIILSSVAAVFAIVCGVGISIFITRPIFRLGNAVKQVASGNLQVEKITIKNKDEIHDLNESFNAMTDNLREMIRSIADHSDQVAASAEQLNASAEQSSKATETVSSAIQEIASSAEKTTTKLELNSSSLHEVLQGIHHISESSATVSELSRETTKEAEEGGNYVKNSLTQMRFIRESVGRSNEVVQTLSQRSTEIGSILDVISDIANQTNLLALNAAIEAARAGEHGKGFAVVADEVRKLAEQSQASTKSIADLITFIQKDTEESVNIMNEVVHNAEEGVKVSEITSEKFAQILTSTKNITPQIEQVTATVQQISASIDEIANSAMEVSRLAQENAASSEEVAASTEEQLASMQEIDASAQALAHMAEELKTVVGRFKI